jgi:hypothetical protein
LVEVDWERSILEASEAACVKSTDPLRVLLALTVLVIRTMVDGSDLLVRTDETAICVKQRSVSTEREGRRRSSDGGRVDARKRRVHGIVPCNECRIVNCIDNRTFQLVGHLEIVVVLDVVALYEGNPSVDDHELGMECTQHGLVVVDDLEIDIGYLVLSR